jgi:REP element-mobilizing transposase RayT
VLNRGNYRSNVFLRGGAKEALLTCLGEACEKMGWVVHAHVVMRNHHHLALERPAANLVEGMRWLQSTYANRFNRLLDERGHVFQGRYQAIVVEDVMRLERDVRSARKSAAWKVAVPAHLRRHTTVKNPRLAARLHLGDPDGVSRYVG